MKDETEVAMGNFTQELLAAEINFEDASAEDVRRVKAELIGVYQAIAEWAMAKANALVKETTHG